MILIVAVSTAAPARAERLPVRVFTTADGLAHNLVHRIYRDRRGFVWFCTREGLSRFDGRTFVSYGIVDGLPSAVINAIAEMPDGTYWVATARGLVLFDPTGRPAMAVDDERRPMFSTFLPGASAESHVVTSVAVDDASNVWVGTHGGLYRLVSGDGSRAEFIAIHPKSAEVEVTALLPEGGTMWIGTSSGLFRWRVDGLTVYRETFLTAPIQALARDAAGTLWVGTTRGLASIGVDARSGEVVRHAVFDKRDGLHSDWVTQVVPTTRGQLWVVTTGGVARADGGTPLTFHRYDLGDPLGSGGTVSMAEDSQKYLWVGTTLGVGRMSISGFSIFDALAGVPTAGAVFTTARHGVLVMSADDEWRISRFDGRRFVPTRLPLTKFQAAWGWNQSTLVDRNGDWWTASRQGILRFDGIHELEDLARARPSRVYDRAGGMPNDVVLRLFEDSRGDIWASTVGEGERANGLSRWQRATGVWTHFGSPEGFPPLLRHFASAFAETAGGDVWIGFSGDGGLVRFRDGVAQRFSEPDGMPIGSVRNLLVDSRGTLWAASYRNGLIQVDDPRAERPRLRAWSTATGLSSNEVGALVEDARGRIYAGTARGIDRLDLTSGGITTYTEIPTTLGEFQAATRDADGALWFSCSAGLIRFVPEEHAASTMVSTLITGLRIGGRPQALPATGASRLSALELPAGTTPLEIDFLAPTGATAGERYQVMLEGADRIWSTPSVQRSVTYARLVSGRYRFLVRAVDNEGVAGQSAELPFTILAPVWRRWWFLSLSGAAFVAAAVALHRRRIARLQAIAGIRTQIASDLHDDLGANLTRIAVLSEVARQQGDRPQAADRYLESIGRVARESVTTMGDIIWAIKPHNRDLHELGRRMREYGEEVCAAANIAFSFDAPTDAMPSKLAPDLRRDIYLVFKEAVNNAVRHSHCRALRASLSRHRGRITLIVADDGRGFDPAATAGGNGVTNLRQRAVRLHGTLTIESTLGAGTVLTLDLPDRRRAPYLIG